MRPLNTLTITDTMDTTMVIVMVMNFSTRSTIIHMVHTEDTDLTALMVLMAMMQRSHDRRKTIWLRTRCDQRYDPFLETGLPKERRRGPTATTLV